MADSAELRGLANNMTVAAWVYMDSATTAAKTGVNPTLNRIIGDDEAWDGDGWSFGVFTNGTLRFTKNGIVDQNLAAGVPQDRWVHLAATVSSTGGTTFYVDGAVAGTNGNTANMNTGLGNNGLADPYAIGRSYGGGEAQWFGGSLDEVRVFDTVLSQSEVQAMLVPEPNSIALLACAGMVGGAFVLRRRRR
ncbi:MAG: LamG-like jellyroll fold domain-containing protein [Pirellulales bacterium]